MDPEDAITYWKLILRPRYHRLPVEHVEIWPSHSWLWACRPTKARSSIRSSNGFCFSKARDCQRSCIQTCETKLRVGTDRSQGTWQGVSHMWLSSCSADILQTKNPFPNVDSSSGVLFHHYGFKETLYYTATFGVSRGLGPLAQHS